MNPLPFLFLVIRVIHFGLNTAVWWTVSINFLKVTNVAQAGADETVDELMSEQRFLLVFLLLGYFQTISSLN